MAILQSRKQSDLEKRLKLLRQQVYGKELRVESTELRVKDKVTTHYQLPTTNYRSDITFLYHDLFKILTLSSLAIGIQLMLFLLVRNHILNLHLF